MRPQAYFPTNFCSFSTFVSGENHALGLFKTICIMKYESKVPWLNIKEANEYQKFRQRQHGFWNFHASQDIYIFNQKFYPEFGFYLIFMMVQNGSKINFK